MYFNVFLESLRRLQGPVGIRIGEKISLWWGLGMGSGRVLPAPAPLTSLNLTIVLRVALKNKTQRRESFNHINNYLHCNFL